MASSKDKAIGLKDAYVQGILDGAGPEASAEAGQAELADLAGKLGIEKSNTASVMFDLNSGDIKGINDGKPYSFITRDGSTTNNGDGENYRYPVDGGVNASGSTPMSINQHKFFSRRFDALRDLDRQGVR